MAEEHTMTTRPYDHSLIIASKNENKTLTMIIVALQSKNRDALVGFLLVLL